MVPLTQALAQLGLSNDESPQPSRREGLSQCQVKHCDLFGFFIIFLVAN